MREWGVDDLASRGIEERFLDFAGAKEEEKVGLLRSE
jgi:hypothetical protein